jgi:hypothetical protein
MHHNSHKTRRKLGPGEDVASFFNSKACNCSLDCWIKLSSGGQITFSVVRFKGSGFCTGSQTITKSLQAEESAPRRSWNEPELLWLNICSKTPGLHVILIAQELDIGCKIKYEMPILVRFHFNLTCSLQIF